MKLLTLFLLAIFFIALYRSRHESEMLRNVEDDVDWLRPFREPREC